MQQIDPHPAPELSLSLRPPVSLPPTWRLYASGRHALAAIAEHEDLREGETVYVPALHCAAMVEPFVSRGASIRYYPIKQDMGADIRWLQDEVSQTRPRFLLGVHFFGFPCPRMQACRELAEQHDATFIEDCAHSLISSGRHSEPASGHWQISSPHKFLGSGEGGVLVAGRGRQAPPELPDAGLITGLRIFLREMQRRTSDHKTIRTRGLRLAERLYRLLRQESQHGAERPSNKQTDNHPTPVQPITTFGRRIISRIDVAGVAARRTVVANRIREHLPNNVWRGLQWPQGDFTPYVVPIWHANADALTESLRKQGVSVLRFGHHRHESYPAGTCAVADELSSHLVQIPCHQQLSDLDVDAVVNAVRESLDAPAE